MSQLKYVGKVVDIDGSSLRFTRKYSSGIKGVFHAHVGMTVFLNDVIEADKNTTAVIEFAVGARATLADGERAVVGYQELSEITPLYGELRTDVENADTLKSLIPILSGMKKKVNKLNSNGKVFEIQTAGGTMGGLEG